MIFILVIMMIELCYFMINLNIYWNSFYTIRIFYKCPLLVSDSNYLHLSQTLLPLFLSEQGNFSDIFRSESIWYFQSSSGFVTFYGNFFHLFHTKHFMYVLINHQHWSFPSQLVFERIKNLLRWWVGIVFSFFFFSQGICFELNWIVMCRWSSQLINFGGLWTANTT